MNPGEATGSRGRFSRLVLLFKNAPPPSPAYDYAVCGGVARAICKESVRFFLQMGKPFRRLLQFLAGRVAFFFSRTGPFSFKLITHARGGSFFIKFEHQLQRGNPARAFGFKKIQLAQIATCRASVRLGLILPQKSIRYAQKRSLLVRQQLRRLDPLDESHQLQMLPSFG